MKSRKYKLSADLVNGESFRFVDDKNNIQYQVIDDIFYTRYGYAHAEKMYLQPDKKVLVFKTL